MTGGSFLLKEVQLYKKKRDKCMKLLRKRLHPYFATFSNPSASYTYKNKVARRCREDARKVADISY